MKTAEFYCAGGGICGTILAGHEPVFSCCRDKWEQEVVGANSSIPTTCGLREIRTDQIPRFDVAIVGTTKELANIAYVIGKTHPFCILAAASKMATDVDAVNAMSALGYTFDAKAYRGVSLGLAQRRSLAAYVFLRRDIKARFDWPTPPGLPEAPSLANVLESPADEALWEGEGLQSRTEKYNDGARKANMGFRVRTYNREDVISGFPQDYRKHYSILVADNGRPRKFSALEAQRLQGFPDDWKMPLSRTRAYDVLGKTIWPPLVKLLLGEAEEIFT